MRVLVAPDKFKGSLTAAEAAAAIAEGVRRVYPDAVVTELPIADGGEGTLEAAYRAGYQRRSTRVTGPTGGSVEAEWALRKGPSGSITALIESAKASGLELMYKSTPNALAANSYGIGQLIAAALDAGAGEVIVGLGGSAMTDGGMGAIRALGLVVRDAGGNDVPLGGRALAEITTVDASGLDSRLAGITLRLALDVQNPLDGPEGAACVFSPQKGADSDAVRVLDAGLHNWSDVLNAASQREVNVPGSGAAGGFPAPFLAFTGAVMESGYAMVAGLTRLADELATTDLVITGEGSLDTQSLEGKAPIALSQAAAELGLPVIVVAGRILVSAKDLDAHGVSAAAQLLDVARWTTGVADADDAIANAALYLRTATAKILRSHLR